MNWVLAEEILFSSLFFPDHLISKIYQYQINLIVAVKKNFHRDIKKFCHPLLEKFQIYTLPLKLNGKNQVSYAELMEAPLIDIIKLLIEVEQVMGEDEKLILSRT